MGAIGAKNSLISTGSAIACSQKWSLSAKADLVRYICSITRGGASRLPGIIDWNGSYQILGHTPGLKPGDTFTFTGVLGGSPGSQLGFSGAAMVDETEVAWDIEGGQPILHTVKFSSNGTLTPSATLNVTAPTSFPDPPTSVGTKIQLATPAASPSFTELADIRTMSIKMKAENQPYASSSSAGYKKRVAGNFDMEAMISLYFDDPTVLPALNDVKHARFFVDGSLYWDLKWLRFGDLAGIDVDRETGKIVGGQLPAYLNGFTNISAAATGGWVKQPNGTAVWDGST